MEKDVVAADCRRTALSINTGSIVEVSYMCLLTGSVFHIG